MHEERFKTSRVGRCRSVSRAWGKSGQVGSWEFGVVWAAPRFSIACELHMDGVVRSEAEEPVVGHGVDMQGQARGVDRAGPRR